AEQPPQSPWPVEPSRIRTIAAPAATMRWRYLKYYLASDLAAMEEQVRKFESQLKLTREALRLIREAVQEITAGRSGNAKIDSLLAHLNANGQLGAGNAALADLHGALKGALQPPPGVAAAGQQQQQQNSRAAAGGQRVAHLPGALVALPAAPGGPADVPTVQRDQLRRRSVEAGLAGDLRFPAVHPANKLQVIVVPHSHNDPAGAIPWMSITARRPLPNLPRMTFIYAEVSFLSMWWSELSNQQRDTAKQLIGSGRLEIVSGGWVMPDEANSHYFALVDQLVEGHQWLEKHIGVRPNSSWQIDPFGHSSSLSYIYRKAGFRRQLVQRVHYSVKKRLARQRQLEFRWKQLWDRSDMLCHMMPFSTATTFRTPAAPTPKSAASSTSTACPAAPSPVRGWRVPPQAISDANVAARAELLLDQYKKKASLFGTNVLLVPLGDDFRYQGNEWTRQYENYDKLMAYINSRADWNANVKFGTLSSDFFTYADRDDHYWSGYYTSRPFHKRLERTLEHSLRSAELLFSYAVGRASETHRRPALKPAHLFESLTTARVPSSPPQNPLITTAESPTCHKIYTQNDPLPPRTPDAAWASSSTMTASRAQPRTTWSLTTAEAAGRAVQRPPGDAPLRPVPAAAATYSSDAGELLADFESRDGHDSLPTPSVIDIRSGAAARYVVIFKPAGQSSQGGHTAGCQRRPCNCQGPRRQGAAGQLLPQFTADWKDIRTDCFGVAVLLRLEPLSLTRLAVSRGPSASLSVSALAHTGAGAPLPAPAPFAAASRPAKLALDSTHQRPARPHQQEAGRPPHAAEREVLHIRSSAWRERSGAYLFLPDGPGRPASDQPGPVTRVSGPLVSEVHRGGQFARTVTRLYASPDSAQGAGLEIESLANVRGNSNLEVAVGWTPGSDRGISTRTSNCLQLAKRTYWEKLPLQANVYPMPCQAFMQSNGVRLSVVAAQPMGVHSPASGSLELFLDRTLAQDDGLGLAQGVLDNRPTPSTFRLLLEAASGPADADGDLGFPAAWPPSAWTPCCTRLWRCPPPGSLPDSDLAGVPARLSLAPPASPATCAPAEPAHPAQ
uniref:Alpha-mann_mid domain-containing protein n=1 Tax=Macrostomum lignano TaxID=282301 RepID=A0A1I8FPM9_9PLAT